MSRGKKPLLENIEIKKIAAEGKSIAYVDEKVLFVPNTVPGDIVDVQVTRKRKSFLEGFIVNVRKYSDIRTEPFCTPFRSVQADANGKTCPINCKLNSKQQEVVDNLQRIGKVELQNVAPIIGSPKTTYYRNKLEYTFCNKRFLTREEIAEGQDINRTPAVGFHVPGLFDKVIDIEKCYLQAEPSNAVRNFIRDYAIVHELSFYDIREQAGFLRTLIIRTSSTGEVMVIVTFGEENREAREGLLHALVQRFPEISLSDVLLSRKK